MAELKDRQQQEMEGKLRFYSHLMLMEHSFTSLEVHNQKIYMWGLAVFACELILSVTKMKSEYPQMHLWNVSTNSTRKRAVRSWEIYCLLVCIHPLS